MKDIIKKVLVGILAVGIVLGTAIYRFMFYNPDKPSTTETKPTVTDAAGTTYYAVTDPNTGSTMVVVTNENGEKFKAEFDGQTVGSTVGTVADDEVEGELPSNYTGPQLPVKPSESNTSASVGSTADNSSAGSNNSGGNNNSAGNNNSGGNNNSAGNNQPDDPQTSTTEQSGNKVDVYRKAFSSGNFLMEVNDADMGLVTMAVKGNKMYMNASMEGMTIKMIYRGDEVDKDHPDGTWYLVLDGLKKYSTMPSEMLADMNMSEITSSFANEEDNLVYTASVVDVDGKLLDCESTTDNNGNTLNYYFDGDVLVRSETITPAGSATVTEFSKITTDVPDSLFEYKIDGYKSMNLEWLMKLAGSSLS